MATYALVFGGKIIETSPTAFPVASPLEWTTDISSVSPEPQVGWSATFNGSAWTFAAPVAPVLTLAQQAQALLAGTIAITSTGTPALSGSYAIDPATQAHLTAEMLSIQVTGKFADGTTTVAWPDASGAVHIFSSVVEFQAFALAVSAFVAACYKVINGVLTTLPTAAATIP